MSINAVFVFYKLSIFLLHKEVKKISTIETALTCSRHLVKYTLKGDTKMNPFTPRLIIISILLTVLIHRQT